MIEVEEMPLMSETKKNQPLEEGRAAKPRHKRGQIWLYAISGALIALIVGGAIVGIVNAEEISIRKGLDQLLTLDFALFVVAGFIAQMIDGALGMAYGASSTSM